MNLEVSSGVVTVKDGRRRLFRFGFRGTQGENLLFVPHLGSSGPSCLHPVT